MSSSQVHLVSAQPILPSQKVAPSRGALIMNQAVNFGMGRLLNELTKANVLLMPLALSTEKTAQQTITKTIQQTNDNLLIMYSKQHLTIYTLVYDHNQKPAIIIQIDMPRHIYRRGVDALWFSFWTILMSAPVALITLLIMLRVVQTHESD